MKTVSGKEFSKILEKQGWRLLRIHGSHHVYGKEDSNVRLSIPIHKNKPLKKGLLRHLMKISGIEKF